MDQSIDKKNKVFRYVYVTRRMHRKFHTCKLIHMSIVSSIKL